METNDEIDSNSAFNKLQKLQMTLKEEIALNEIFKENHMDLLNKIEQICYDYYKERISIQEKYEQSNASSEEEHIKYVVSENSKKVIDQCYVPFERLMFYFRDSNDLTLRLIEHCPKESYDLLANFICNYYYVNIFSSSFLNENLLTLIYLLLEKEIDKLSNEKSSFLNFLDSSTSFTAHLLKHLSRRDEVKVYLESVLKKILIETAGFLPNQKNKMFIGLDINNIKTFLNKKKYDLPKGQKKAENLNEILTQDIIKSRLNIMKFITKKKSKSKNEENELDKEEMGDNCYEESTKESFEDLLLGSQDDDEEIKKLIDGDSENKNREKILLLEGISSSNKKVRKVKDDIENYLINSGFYNKPKIKGQSEEEKRREEQEAKIKKEKDKFIEKNRDKIFNDLYCKELNKETLLKIQEEDDMEEYIKNKIKYLEEGMRFNNINLVNKIMNDSKAKAISDKIILIYKYHFELIKNFIDELFTSLVKNKENTPYLIRAICTIISQLLDIKFPQISNIQKISLISEFVFTNLIIPILINPNFNGIMMYNFENNDKQECSLRTSKMETITSIIKKLLKGELFNGQNKNEENYTIFNSYFIEIMPHIIEFFRNISSTKLPINIEKLIEYRKNNSNISPLEGGDKENVSKEQKDIEFNYLKAHPEERLEHQSICLTWKEYQVIYNIIKSNEEDIIGDKKGIIQTFKKLVFHEATFKKLIKIDEINSQRKYIYCEKMIFTEELQKELDEKENKKISFQTNETLNAENNEIFILKRIKYCIKTIIKHLNNLSKNNFLEDENESIENIVKGLIKMINLEGSSESLRENSLPLEWFGLYLQSNIENIPSEYKENNYSKLYDELIDETKQNLENIQNDNSLNVFYSKIINSEKLIDISHNNLKKIQINEKNFKILDFILNSKIPVTINIYRNKEKEMTHIEFVKEGNKSNYKHDQNEKLTALNCKKIVDFCELFPFLSQENTTDIFQFEENIQLNNSLREYFNIIHNYIKEEESFKEYKDEEEQIKILIQIEDFIHSLLFDKIYSDFPDPLDITIFKRCYTLKWIKPTMLDEKLSFIDEKMTEMMISLIKNMDEKFSPNNKLRELEKLDSLINNVIELYGYPKDVYLNMLTFAFIMGQPSQLNSSLKYISMFYSKNLPNYKGIDLIIKFGQLLNKIMNFSEKDLVGMSKDAYEKNIKNSIIIKKDSE